MIQETEFCFYEICYLNLFRLEMSKNTNLPKLDYQAFYITRDKIHNFAIVLGIEGVALNMFYN